MTASVDTDPQGGAAETPETRSPTPSDDTRALVEENWFERMQREESEARTSAGICEIKRRIDAGEFPDNDDTIKAFSAGWFGSFEYRGDVHRLSNDTNATGMMGGMLLSVIGGLLLTTVVMLWYGGVPLSSRAPWLGVVGLAMLIAAPFSFRVGSRQAASARKKFSDKWGEKQ